MQIILLGTILNNTNSTNMKKVILTLLAILTFSTNSIAQEAVDLGLSVKWASYNVGATVPEEIGGKFVCGTTEIWYKSQKTKDRGIYINHDYDYSGDPAYDVATAYWGNEWRTPTKEEWEELINKCKWEKLKLPLSNGANILGYQVTGVNGNSIFIPMTLAHYLGGSNKYGLYQTSTPVQDKTHMWVIYLQIIMGKHHNMMWYEYGGMYNDQGFVTRAVSDK